MNLKRDFLTKGRGFQPTKERESQVRFFFKSKAKRRVKRVEADVSEKIALICVAKYYESVIHIAVIYFWLESGLKKFRFMMVANNNIGKGWSKEWFHCNSVDLVIHDVIKAKLDRKSGHLHKFNQNITWKRCRRVLRTVVGFSTDLNSVR